MEQIWQPWLPVDNLTGPADLGMSRASSHPPLEHWGSVLSFLWKRTIRLSWNPWLKLVLPQKLRVYKGFSKTKVPSADRSGWPWPLVVTSHLPLKPWCSVASF